MILISCHGNLAQQNMEALRTGQKKTIRNTCILADGQDRTQRMKNCLYHFGQTIKAIADALDISLFALWLTLTT